MVTAQLTARPRSDHGHTPPHRTPKSFPHSTDWKLTLTLSNPSYYRWNPSSLSYYRSSFCSKQSALERGICCRVYESWPRFPPPCCCSIILDPFVSPNGLLYGLLVGRLLLLTKFPFPWLPPQRHSIDWARRHFQPHFHMDSQWTLWSQNLGLFYIFLIPPNCHRIAWIP